MLHVHVHVPIEGLEEKLRRRLCSSGELSSSWSGFEERSMTEVRVLSTCPRAQIHWNHGLLANLAMIHENQPEVLEHHGFHGLRVFSSSDT